jgi:BirA family biotin operon repressor/biotin-[acetyl-CoA-carboxylase] ligase
MSIDLRYFPILDSTMTKTAELLANGMPTPSIVLADTQTAGRGRIEGRTWEGHEGASLLMTLALDLPGAARNALTLKAGLALCIVLERRLSKDTEQGASAARVFEIKWPNDIIAQTNKGRGKIAGILCETKEPFVLVGIGVNLDSSAYPMSLSVHSANLKDIQPSVSFNLAARKEFAMEIAEAIIETLAEAQWKKSYEARLWAKDRTIRFLLGHPNLGNKVMGVERGIDETGRLLIETTEGTVEAFHSGEVSKQELAQ